jgi:uncharacterized NAD(P)/FAD-binding protein YdhS
LLLVPTFYINLVQKGGIANAKELRLGLETDQNGAMVDREGRASSSIFTIGLLRKGNLWETTAVPELREQAVELAAVLTRDLVGMGDPAAARANLRRPGGLADPQAEVA